MKEQKQRFFTWVSLWRITVCKVSLLWKGGFLAKSVIYVCMCLYVCVHLYVCMAVCMFILYVGVYLCLCLSLCVCVFIMSV